MVWVCSVMVRHLEDLNLLASEHPWPLGDGSTPLAPAVLWWSEQQDWLLAPGPSLPLSW